MATKLINSIESNNTLLTTKKKKTVQNSPKKTHKKGSVLDTLEVLNGNAPNPPILEGLDKVRFQKRARAKYLTNSYLFKLIDLDSPFKQKYWNTYHCTAKLTQVNDKITSEYCGCRWCLVCNRIRTAKCINNYKPKLDKLEDPHFVTLTIKSCKGKDLKQVIEEMYSTASKIQRNIKDRLRYKDSPLEVVGIRKFECTWNCYTNEFHPHFHFILDSLEVAEMFEKDWLKKYPISVKKAQNITKCYGNSMLELFKYFTKIVSSKKDSKKYVTAEALDIIFQASFNRNVFQSFGKGMLGSKNIESIDKLEAEQLTKDYYDIRDRSFWDWNEDITDWEYIFRDRKLVLCGYEPSERDKEYGKLIKGSKKKESKQLKLFKAK